MPTDSHPEVDSVLVRINVEKALYERVTKMADLLVVPTRYLICRAVVLGISVMEREIKRMKSTNPPPTRQP